MISHAVAGILVGLLIALIVSGAENWKIDKYWRDWEVNSFEYDGTRFNKDYYEIVDGELRMKK